MAVEYNNPFYALRAWATLSLTTAATYSRIMIPAAHPKALQVKHPSQFAQHLSESLDVLLVHFSVIERVAQLLLYQ
jgi:hypothetical protein